jgi:cytochrome c oxidase subunit 2
MAADGVLGLPPDISTHGAEIDQLMVYIHILMLVLFIGWGLFFMYTLFRFRAKNNPKGNYEGVKSKASKYLEIAVAACEGVLLLFFAIPIYGKRVTNFPDPSAAVNIDVIAEQFAWNIHYPGADGLFGERKPELVDQGSNPIGLDRSGDGADDIVKVNQLHIPVNKDVIIRLSSKDVIHCFNLPVMRIKQDVLPGSRIPIHFQAKETIKHEITCAQLCGLGHYRMKGFLTVETEAEFEDWLAKEAEALAELDEDDGWGDEEE